MKKLNAILFVSLCMSASLDPEVSHAHNEPLSHSNSCTENSVDIRERDKKCLLGSDDDCMKQTIKDAYRAFIAGVGPDQNRLWTRGGGPNGGEPKYRCSMIPKEQRLHRLDFSVFSQEEFENENFDFRGACLRKSSFKGLKLSKVALKGANLYGACLRNTNLNGLDLRNMAPDNGEEDRSNTVLERSDLQLADLQNVKLDGVALVRNNMLGTFIAGKGISLKDVIFEPMTVPSLRGLDERADQLRLLRYKSTSDGLAALREALRQGGLQKAERAITYAIESHRLESMQGLEKHVRTVLFLWPTDFGLYPGNALWGLLIFWAAFTVIYALVILINKDELGGIHKFYPAPSESVQHFCNADRKPPTKIETRNPLWAFSWAAYFSLISAFHIGWRDFNMGEWLVRMNPSDFTLRATGFTRVFTTIQSIVSVYLIAMCALTYFGRPFG